MRKFFFVITELLAIAVFIIAAFFAPQVIFQVQDTLMCSKTELSEREKVDAETLSTSYEKSLGLRMLNFADGLEAGDSFYVTSQELTIGQEIYDFLYSDSGFYQEFIILFINEGLISFHLIEDFWVSLCTVSQWTQYVIYSDNYAKGVNFILWYIELQDDEQHVTTKLLVDAETGTLYALRTEQANTNETSILSAINDNYFDDNIWREKSLPSLWWEFASYYEVQNESAFSAVYQKLLEEGVVWELGNEYVYDYTDMSGQEIIIVNGLLADKYELDGNTMRFQLPYGETSLEVLLDMNTERFVFYNCPEMTFGVRQIYEMIPEFA